MGGIEFKKGAEKGRPCLSSRSPQLIGLNILSSFDIEIPVPEGNEETVCKIADMLVRSN
jgi:hypothetical protein